MVPKAEIRVNVSLQWILASIVLSIALPLAVLAIYGVLAIDQTGRARTSEILRFQAQTYAALLDHGIGDGAAVLRGLATSPGLQRDDLNSFANVLKTADIPAGDILALASPDGALLLNTTTPHAGAALAARIRAPELLRLAASGQAGVTSLYMGVDSGRERLAIARPVVVVGSGGTVRYVLIYSMLASRLREAVFADPVPAGVIVHLIDRAGIIVASSGGIGNLVGQPVDPQISAAAKAQDSGTFRLVAPDRDGPTTVAFAHARISGFTVAMMAPDSFVLPAVQSHLWLMLMAAGLLCLPGGILVALARERLIAGLGVLTQIGRGEVGPERPTAIREIDAAAAALRAAKAAEADAAAKLLTINAELERRVEQAVAERDLVRERNMHARRMETLGALASGMAHDFGNVLQVVDGCATLIHENPEDPAAVERWATMLEAVIKRGRAVVSRLLSFSRRDALRASDFDVRAMLDGVAEMLSHTVPKRITVRVDVPDRLPSMWADRAQLETVLMNLATNARDAIEGVGTFTLSAREVDADSRLPNSSGRRQIRIDATDTGVGMPPDVLARASEPFFTTKNAGQGTGLGLAMARDLAEQSGGEMTIASTPGRGTTITLLLPAGTSEPVPADTSRDTPPPPAHDAVPARVLLVDDMALLRDVVARHLVKRGMDVKVCDKGQPALDLVASGEPIDIVITDFCMPDLHADRLIPALHAMRPGLPIILLTGNADVADVFLGGYEARDAVLLMHKPTSGRDIVTAINQTLRRNNVNRLVHQYLSA